MCLGPNTTTVTAKSANSTFYPVSACLALLTLQTLGWLSGESENGSQVIKWGAPITPWHGSLCKRKFALHQKLNFYVESYIPSTQILWNIFHVKQSMKAILWFGLTTDSFVKETTKFSMHQKTPKYCFFSLVATPFMAQATWVHVPDNSITYGSSSTT